MPPPNTESENEEHTCRRYQCNREVLRSDRLGVLLIGTGAVAVPYLKCAHENEHLKLVAIADPNAAARKEAEEKYGPVVSVSDYKEVIDRPDVDLVIVCTPHFLHHSMVTSALNAGKHVICEKPIAITLAEADDMLDTAARNNKMFLVTMNMFFNPWAIGIRRLLGEKKLGKVFMAQSSYLGYEVARFAIPATGKAICRRRAAASCWTEDTTSFIR